MNKHLSLSVLIVALFATLTVLFAANRGEKTTLIPKDIREGDILEVRYTDSGVIQLEYPEKKEDDYFMITLDDGSLMWISPIERGVIMERNKRVKFFNDMEELLNYVCKTLNE